MVSALARRGPDSEGIELWPGAGLGQRRLAILDLSDAGKQPMLSDDGEIGIVFNGCIYNFWEIKEELEKLGHRFRSRCDTEVLLRGYQQWGIDVLLKRLRGMFAFGIWDNPARKLTLVRDRLGVKPLLYATGKNSIGFASTITALHDADLAGDISPEAVLEFLEFDWVTDARAIFTGVYKVPAATILEWQDGRIEQRQYWTLPKANGRMVSFDEAVEQTEAILLEAAKLRLVSDVPVGALLSGGIDSALICWAMSRVGGSVKTFTVSTPGDPADEAGAAAATAQALGVPHEIIELPTDEQPELDELVAAYGEPFACGSALGLLRVCKAVKPKVTVLLTGDGGDDVFLGYPHHRTFFQAQKLSSFVPSPVAAIWPSLDPGVDSWRPLHRIWRFMDYASGGLGAVTEAHDGLPYFDRHGMLGERLAGKPLDQRQIQRSVESARSLLAEILEYERNHRFVSEFMTKVDGGTMHYAIEARAPFLDHVLWEFAGSLPFDVRLHRNELKAVLRAIVRKRIGDHVAGRRKQGFTVPVDRWLAGKWKPQILTLAEDSLLEKDGWIRRGILANVVPRAVSDGRIPRQLWSLLILERWMRSRGSRRLVRA